MWLRLADEAGMKNITFVFILMKLTLNFFELIFVF